MSRSGPASIIRRASVLTAMVWSLLVPTALLLPPAAGAAPSAAPEPAVPVGTAPAAVAPVAAGPELSITIDNGKLSADVGETLDYVITVVNLGTTDIGQLRITQSLPPGLQFGSADAGGTADGTGVSWSVDLKATTSAILHTTMTVTATPADLLRLATVACAATSSEGPPIVCAAHSDQLPAGAAADAAQAAMVTAPADGQPWWYVPAGGAAVLFAALLVLLAVIRRRSDTRQPVA